MTELIGRTFARLTAVEYCEKFKVTDKSQPRNYYKCECSCGSVRYIQGAQLLNGQRTSCGCRQKELALSVGDNFKSVYGDYTIIEKLSPRWYMVQFTDGFVTKSDRKTLVEGKVRNPYTPFVAGVGYFGEGKFVCKANGKNTLEYEVWNGLFKRCYNIPRQQKTRPTYAGCSVVPEWHNYQTFATWYTSQEHYGKGYHLDKDLTIVGNKVYGPDTCCLIPEEVNQLFTGTNHKSPYATGVHWCKNKKKFIAQCQTGELTAKGGPKQTYLGSYDTELGASNTYKVRKSARVKEVATRFRSEISETIYNNLINLADTLLLEVENDR